MKIAFLHIPKTGGTYISMLKLGWRLSYWGHSSIVDDTVEDSLVSPFRDGLIRVVPYSTIKQYYVFATVRNIYSWLVSYAGHAGGWNSQYHDTGHYDYKAANKGFDYLLKTIADRSDGAWPNRKLIFTQLFCGNSEFIADRLIKTETIDQGMALFAEKLNIEYKPIERQRVGVHADYRTYYTDKLAELVQNTWGRELQLFGYTFEGETHSRIAFNCTLDKTKYRYDYEKDLLIILPEYN